MNQKGQFSIIAALLVAVILIATVAFTYSAIRNSPIQTQPQVLSAIDETNLAVRQILGFTVGYYGSVLKVTGNTSFARLLALNYLHSGLVNIAVMHPEWGTSFNVTNSQLSTHWFTNSSRSMGNVAVNYSLTGLGIQGITYESACRLDVTILNGTDSQACLAVSKDEAEPVINLGKRNFKFYRYTFADSKWEMVEPSAEPVSYANGTYQIDLPPGVDKYSFLIQVEDPRGIVVVASSFSVYTCSLTWNSTIYSTLKDAKLVAEFMQNGTIRWLGQNLELTSQAKPLPPIPVKALHVNQTANNVNSEAPFQIEDWASDYKIPLGLTNNASVFSSRTLLVFLADSNVSKITIWWNGSDNAVQTPYAFRNQYFTWDNPSARRLNNSRLVLQFSSDSTFTLDATIGTSRSTANFMRINNEASTYGSSLAYVITGGVVRDIVHQEAEWGTGADGCPNIYAHIVLTLPANTTYYTYQLRLMFVQSQQSRTITDLRPITIKTYTGQPQTENGTSGGFPIVSGNTGSFYNSSSPYWAHHWSQFTSGTTGAGIMFANSSNEKLYCFDTIAGSKTGALKISNSTDRRIELLPVTLASVSFTYAMETIWDGAVVTFDNTTPVFKIEGANRTGLWIMVEYPPTIAVSTES
jgi:hypothetical protein